MKGVDLIKKLGAVLLGALDKRGAFWKSKKSPKKLKLLQW